MKTLLVLFLMLSVSAPSDSSNEHVRATVLPESGLSITGSSTINRFECEAGVVSGAGYFDGVRADAWVTVAVPSFDCGRQRMNRDMQHALKADKHPEIIFEMASVEGSRQAVEGTLRVKGTLTIAGVARTVLVEAAVERRSGGRYRVSGKKEIQMSDFGIDPPTALAGLIQVHDRIVVHFDLVASTNSTTSGGTRPAAASAGPAL